MYTSSLSNCRHVHNVINCNPHELKSCDFHNFSACGLNVFICIYRNRDSEYIIKLFNDLSRIYCPDMPKVESAKLCVSCFLHQKSACITFKPPTGGSILFKLQVRSDHVKCKLLLCMCLCMLVCGMFFPYGVLCSL